MCYDTKRFAAAARLWAEALAADPKLGDDRRDNHRYNAACAAALAGCGRGADDPRPDDAARARLRGQALGMARGRAGGLGEGARFGRCPGPPAGAADARALAG